MTYLRVTSQWTSGILLPLLFSYDWTSLWRMLGSICHAPFGRKKKKDSQCTYNVTLKRVYETIVAVEKQQVLHISLCVHACACVRARGYSGAWVSACAYVHIALLFQHATRMRHVVTSFVARLSPIYFSTLAHKRYDSRKKKLLNVKCVFSFSIQLLSKTFLILRRILATFRQKCWNVFM